VSISTGASSPGPSPSANGRRCRTGWWPEASWLAFASANNRFQFLLFHDIEVPPTHIKVDAYLGDLSWAEAQDIYLKAHHGEFVERPKLEPFEVPGADAATKLVYFTEANLETHVLAASYNHAFRKDGIDVLVRAVFADLGLSQNNF
jgi:hypothetical protein